MRAARFAAFTLLAIAASVRAEPLPEPIHGPALICFKYSMFRLLPGERIVDFGAGTETMRIRVKSSKGQFDIGESEIWATPDGQSTVLLRHGQTSVVRYTTRRPHSYAIFGPTSDSGGKDRLVISLTVTTLAGKEDDASIYRRFDVGDPGDADCAHSFTYGWEFLLGG